MWLSTFNAGSVPGRLNVPKRARHDPNDFFRAQKRVQRRDSLDPSLQQQNLQPSHDTTYRMRIGQWLDAESFGGLDVDCPPDTPTELKNAGVAPSPTTRKSSTDQRNTLDTSRRVRQQIEAGTTDQDNEAEDEHEGDDDQQLKELFSRLLSRMQRSDQQVPAEDNGFSEPDDQQDEEGHTSQSDGRHVHVTSAFSHLAGIELEDKTTVLDSHPKPFDLSPFELAFALWEKKHNISRAAHSHLREVLQLVQSLDELKNIPQRKDTVMHRLHRVIPRGTLRKTVLKLDQSVLPSRVSHEEPMLVLDMGDMVRSLLSSTELSRKIYTGMARVTDGAVTDPWQARWWGESIRTTSGNFFYYPDGSPIFPSDFVLFRCDQHAAGCQCGSGQQGDLHHGRVRYCGLDSRGGHPLRPLLLTQRVFARSDMPSEMHAAAHSLPGLPIAPGSAELILTEDFEISLCPAQIVCRTVEVDLDYNFDPTCNTPAPVPEPSAPPFAVRYIFNWKSKEFRPLRLSSPHRAELELRTWGRQHFIDNFVGTGCISLPWNLFCDGFGLYSNNYASILGIYLTALFFEEWLRNRREGMFPLTLGPFGSDISDVLQSILHISELDKGKYLDINGRQVFVCSFVAYITGDMLSQQKLAGCKSHQATLPCRNCQIRIDERSDLSFDTVKNGRYHWQHVDDIAYVQSLPTKTARTSAETKLGIHSDSRLTNNIMLLFPALDLLRTRPVDAAHSEFAGIARLLTDFLFEDEGFLHERSRREMAFAFQTFPFPPGWARIQNPKTHRNSFRMKEYGRLIVIAPILMSGWLQPDHIKPEFNHLLVNCAHQFLDLSDFSYPPVNFRPREWLITAYWKVTQSVIAIFSRTSSISQEEFRRVVISGRRAVQLMCHVLGEGKRNAALINLQNRENRNRQRDAAATQRQAIPPPPPFMGEQTTSPSVVPPVTANPAPSVTSRASMRRRAIPPEQRASEILGKKGLPNIHQGLHLPDVAEEYGSCRLALTFQGEDRHKEFTRDILATNHRNAASTLIQRTNDRLSISLILAGSCEQRYPELHSAFQTLRETCPRLAAAYDPYFGGDGTQPEGDISSAEIEADRSHKNPLALHGLPQSWARTRRDPLLRVLSPQKEPKDSEFIRLLRRAFSNDYGRQAVIWGNKILQWAEKVSFAVRERSVRRVFTVGDFIKVQDEDGTDSFARLDGLFTFHQTGKTYLFAVLTFAVPRTENPTREGILECPIYDMTDRRGIVGLPSILPDQVWLVRRGEGSYVYINHDIYFM